MLAEKLLLETLSYRPLLYIRFKLTVTILPKQIQDIPYQLQVT